MGGGENQPRDSAPKTGHECATLGRAWHGGRHASALACELVSTPHPLAVAPTRVQLGAAEARHKGVCADLGAVRASLASAEGRVETRDVEIRELHARIAKREELIKVGQWLLLCVCVGWWWRWRWGGMLGVVWRCVAREGWEHAAHRSHW